LSRGIQTTADLNWPSDPDHMRDIAHAQTIQDGSFTADAAYLGERVWYNPLVPTLLAALSSVLDVPINVLHTRGGAYLNLAAPIAFYAMAVALLGAPSALAALYAFLMLSREPSWLTATYSPWLFTANFVQALFYTGVLAYLRAYRRCDWTSHVITGVVLGLTFLGHTAPALLLGAMIGTATIYRIVREADERRRPLWHLLVVITIAAGIAAPLLLSIVGHYQLRVKNPVPSSWLDDSLQLDRWRSLLVANLARPVVNALIVIAVARLLMAPPRRAGTRLLITAWIGASATLLLWTAYAPQVPATSWIPGIVPAHHFLVYVRASEALLFGHGVWICASLAARFVLAQAWVGNWAKPPQVARWLAIIAVALLVLWSRPSQDKQYDFSTLRPASLQTYRDAEARQVFAWLRNHSEPSAVFLTAENSGLSMISVAGRKAISLPRFFSNPYVDYESRSEARRQMWESLEAGDCAAFHNVARHYHVSHVLAIEGSTPVPPPGRCDLELVFASGRFAMFTVPEHR
jgi:hypothetical protein